MEKIEVQALARQMIDAVRRFVAAAESKLAGQIEALSARLKGLEDRPAPKDGKDGVSIDVERVLAALREEVAARVAALPVPKDGKDAELPDIPALVKSALDALPKPRDGKDGKDGTNGRDGKDGEAAQVTSEFIDALVIRVAALVPAPKDGKDASAPDISSIIAAVLEGLPDIDALVKDQVHSKVLEAVAVAVAGLPKPQDGKDGVSPTAAQVAAAMMPELREAAEAVIKEEVAALPTKQGEKGEKGDSVSLTEVRVMINEESARLVAALPKPKDGESVHPDSIRQMVADAVAALPKPRDGCDGKDAAQLDTLPSIDEAKSYRRGTWASHNNGLIRAVRQTDPVRDGDLIAAGWTVIVEGVAAVVVSQGDDPREITVASMLTSGVKSISTVFIPMVMYKEVWREGEYKQGDAVTWGGSMWYCMRTTSEKPAYGCADWKLMVKEGRPGKDAGAKVAAPIKAVQL